MKKRARREALPAELGIAIGLIWGHLNTGRFEPAYLLGRVCRRIWPDDERLALLLAYAQVELFDEPDDALLILLGNNACPDWAALLARRCGPRPPN
jgi:hypothetical protein